MDKDTGDRFRQTKVRDAEKRGREAFADRDLKACDKEHDPEMREICRAAYRAAEKIDDVWQP